MQCFCCCSLSSTIISVFHRRDRSPYGQGIIEHVPITLCHHLPCQFGLNMFHLRTQLFLILSWFSCGFLFLFRWMSNSSCFITIFILVFNFVIIFYSGVPHTAGVPLLLFSITHTHHTTPRSPSPHEPLYLTQSSAHIFEYCTI